MLRECDQIELPRQIAKRFLEDMRAYFAEPDGHKADAIAARQLRVLREYPAGKKLRLDDVKKMFKEMRAHLGE
jgi:hypothetical protein